MRSGSIESPLHGLRERDPLPVGQAPGEVGAQVADERPRAEAPGSEARLLGGHREDLDRAARRAARTAQAIDGLDRGEHAVDAIERTGVERGVEVGADKQTGPAGAAALETTEGIPDRVATRAEARMRHPSLDQPETFLVELGVALARDALIRRCGADARKTRNPLVQTAHVSGGPCQAESAGDAPGRTTTPSINP